MTCPDCGAELVQQRLPTCLRWRGHEGFVPEGEATYWVHRVGTRCEAPKEAE